MWYVGLYSFCSNEIKICLKQLVFNFCYKPSKLLILKPFMGFYVGGSSYRPFAWGLYKESLNSFLDIGKYS